MGMHSLVAVVQIQLIIVTAEDMHFCYCRLITRSNCCSATTSEFSLGWHSGNPAFRIFLYNCTTFHGMSDQMLTHSAFIALLLNPTYFLIDIVILKCQIVS